MQHGKTAAVVLLCLTAQNVHASLTATDKGLGVYDSGINATWTQDANLLGTLEAGNSNLITTIVKDEKVAISATYGYTLSSSDFGINGMVDWWAAQAYVSYLNSLNNGAGYGGSKQWALPTTPNNAVVDYNQSNSQLGELFYKELGGIAGRPIPASSLFSNEQAYVYWSGSQIAVFPFDAWFFYTIDGYQSQYGDQSNQFYAWAVSPGKLNSVPVSGAVWFFGAGILGLLSLKRRDQAG